jgi:hypothetical protein
MKTLDLRVSDFDHPVRQVAIKFQQTDLWNRLGREFSLAADCGDQTVGGKCARR